MFQHCCRGLVISLPTSRSCRHPSNRQPSLQQATKTLLCADMNEFPAPVTCHVRLCTTHFQNAISRWPAAEGNLDLRGSWLLHSCARSQKDSGNDLHNGAQKRSSHHVSRAIESQSMAGCSRWNITERSRGQDSVTDGYEPIDHEKRVEHCRSMTSCQKSFMRLSASRADPMASSRTTLICSHLCSRIDIER